MKVLLVSVILFLLVSSCSTGLYSHYPKSKKINEKQVQLQSQPVFKKKYYSYNQLSLKENKIGFELDSQFDVIVGRVPLPTLYNSHQVGKLIPPGDGKPKDATHTNKKAKRAFVSSIIALGSLVAGITVAPFFLIIMVVFAAIAFYYSAKALKEIKRTGEYGKPKAEFALYSSISILVLSIVGLVAYLMSNGTGIQIGNFVLR